MRFKDIPRFIHGGSYAVDVPLNYLEEWLANQQKDQGIDMDPDFQRGHVWSDGQASKYIEFLLRGGVSSREIRWNHPAYTSNPEPHCDLAEQLLLVDGKQRVTACLRFTRGELRAFGCYLREFEGDARGSLGITGARLIMNVNNLQTRRELLQWYLDLNEGGVVHSPQELARVRDLLAREQPPRK